MATIPILKFDALLAQTQVLAPRALVAGKAYLAVLSKGDISSNAFEILDDTNAIRDSISAPANTGSISARFVFGDGTNLWSVSLAG